MKKLFFKFIRFIQNTCITLLLTIVYFIGVGITSLLAIFFRGNLFNKDYVGTNTYWVKANDYENKTENYIHQS